MEESANPRGSCNIGVRHPDRKENCMADPENTTEQGKPHPLREIVQPFIDAARAPRPSVGEQPAVPA